MTSPALRTCIWFDSGQARQAAEFYAATFPNSSVDTAQTAATDYPDGQQGDEITVEFTVLGQPFVGLNGGPAFRPNEGISFQVSTADQAETDRYWDAIVGSGGRASQCGWCADRWGVCWQIIPQALTDGLSDPDPAAAQRVMAAMMTMQKLDVAALEAARRGEG